MNIQFSNDWERCPEGNGVAESVFDSSSRVNKIIGNLDYNEA